MYNSYGFPRFRCFSFLVNVIAFCKAHTWASLNGNVNRLIHQIEEATTVDELTLIQSKMLVLASGHKLLREENDTYLAPVVSKSKGSMGRGSSASGGSAYIGGSSASGSTSGDAAQQVEAAHTSGEAAQQVEAQLEASHTSGDAAQQVEAAHTSGEAAQQVEAQLEASHTPGVIVAKPSSKPYFRLLQQTGKARAIAKSGKMPPQNKFGYTSARPTTDCIQDLQARRAKSKPPAVPVKAMPSQPQTPQKAGSSQPKTPPKAKHMPTQPTGPPPRHLMAASSVATCIVDDDDSDSSDWGDWQGDRNKGADSVADSVAGSLAAESVADSMADSVTDQVETYKQWNSAGDTELHQGILDAIQELTKKAEDRKSELGSAASNKSSDDKRPKWWKKRGTSSRGGSYGTYGLYIEVL